MDTQIQPYSALVEQIRKSIGPGRETELESILRCLKEMHCDLSKNPITGAPNGKELHSDLDKILEDHREVVDKTENIYVVMADIDNFGKFNKVYGEQVGNRVLKAVTEVIRDSLRDDDFIIQLSNKSYDYHLHGEEMLTIYSCKSLKDACSVANRLRQTVEKKCLEKTGHKVTISLGISEWAHDDEPFEEAQKRADRDMQMAKTEGRNQVYCRELDPLFVVKRKFYQPGRVDELVRTVSDSVRLLKGAVGSTATYVANQILSYRK